MFYLCYFPNPTEANSLLVQVLEVIKMYTEKTFSIEKKNLFNVNILIISMVKKIVLKYYNK